jgi:hypothetical protein
MRQFPTYEMNLFVTDALPCAPLEAAEDDMSKPAFLTIERVK